MPSGSASPGSAWLSRLRPPHRIAPRLSQALDISRWAAAALVTTEHVRGIVFAGYRQMHGGMNLFAKGVFFVTDFGHQAVIVFFVLSGYLVGGEALQGFQRGDFDGRAYAVRRAARLYAVYIAALALGGAFDWIGAHHFNSSGLYTHQVHAQDLPYSIVEHLNPPTLLANLIFCQGLLAGTFGSNAPLWSLSNEAWYYLMFPLLLGALLARKGGVRLACLAVLAGAAWFVRGQLLVYSSIWLLGLAPRLLTGPAFKSFWWPLCMIGMIAAATRVGLLDNLTELQQDLLLALAFALFINSVDHAAPSAPPRFAGVHRELAGFSYSLYLLHDPFIFLFVVVAWERFGTGLRMTEFTGGSFAFFAAALGAFYAFAWSIARLTERNTPALRRWLGRLAGVPERSR